MFAIRKLAVRQVVLALVLTGAVAACSDDPTDPGVNPAVVGTWNASAFTLGGMDLIAMGVGLSFSFNADGTYSFAITNDQVGLCDTGVNCTDGGDYSTSDTQITLDPGTLDETALNYSISGATMTVTGDIEEGGQLTASFVKQQ